MRAAFFDCLVLECDLLCISDLKCVAKISVEASQIKE